MANSINNSLDSPFNVGGTSVVTSGDQLNLLSVATTPPITQIVRTEYTMSGTYTPTTGMVYADFEMIGAGGGGGGCLGGVSTGSAAAGGGAGGYLKFLASAAQVGASATITIDNIGGAGGNAGNHPGTGGGDTVVALSGVGSITLTAGGGDGGAGDSTTSGVSGSAGGAGGTSSGGDINTQGVYGGAGFVVSVPTASTLTIGGVGGCNPMFGSVQFASSEGGGSGQAGADGIGFGSGGNGGATLTSSKAGGDGAPGYLVITEYLSA